MYEVIGTLLSAGRRVEMKELEFVHVGSLQCPDIVFKIFDTL